MGSINNIEVFRSWLIDNDFHFIEKVNGHFQVFDYETQKIAFQVWATTEKMIDNPGDKAQQKRWTGFPMIYKVLIGWKTPREKVFGMCDVRRHFVQAYDTNKGWLYTNVLVVAVSLPSGAIEVITNYYDIQNKMEYYLNAYDDDFRLKTKPEVRVVGFMLV